MRLFRLSVLAVIVVASYTVGSGPLTADGGPPSPSSPGTGVPGGAGAPPSGGPVSGENSSPAPSSPSCADTCGYAVVDNRGVVHGVIVCQEGCFGGVMPIDYMGCPAGCSLVLQSPADSTGNVAGVHGPNVVYTPTDNTFRQIGDDGNETWTLVGGQPLDSATVTPPPVPDPPPTTPADPTTPTNPIEPTLPSEPIPTDGYVAPSGQTYETVSQMVESESIIELTTTEVSVELPPLPNAGVTYLALFDPNGPQSLYEVERGELDSGLAPMSVRTVQRSRHSLSIERTKFGSASGKLFVVLATDSEWLGVVSTAVQPPKKYSNCKALRKDYPSGVSRAADVADKGKKATSTGPLPVVNPDVYARNTRLDADKDGIACEV